MTIVVQPAKKKYFGYSPLAEMFISFAKENPKIKFIIFRDKAMQFLNEIPINVIFSDVSFTTNNKLTAYYWQKVKLPALLQKVNADYFITDAFPATNYKQTKSFYLAPRSFLPPVFSNNSKEISSLAKKEEDPFFAFYVNQSTAPNIILALKAFSFFKRRLRSGYKLILLLDGLTEENLIPGLVSYKYRSDILLLTINTIEDFRYFSKHALAFLYFPTENPDIFFMRSVLSNAGIMMTESDKKLGLNDLLQVALIPEEIAEKMMLLYKDETFAGKQRQKALNTNENENPVTLDALLNGEYNYIKAV